MELLGQFEVGTVDVTTEVSHVELARYDLPLSPVVQVMGVSAVLTNSGTGTCGVYVQFGTLPAAANTQWGDWAHIAFTATPGGKYLTAVLAQPVSVAANIDNLTLAANTCVNGLTGVSLRVVAYSDADFDAGATLIPTIYLIG